MLLPIFVAKLTWHRILKDRSVIWFTNNEAVKDSLITGASRNLISLDLLFAHSVFESFQAGRNWLARVPSTSNPSDEPSRNLACAFLAARSARLCVPVWPVFVAGFVCRSWLFDLISRRGV